MYVTAELELVHSDTHNFPHAGDRARIEVSKGAVRRGENLGAASNLCTGIGNMTLKFPGVGAHTWTPD